MYYSDTKTTNTRKGEIFMKNLTPVLVNGRWYVKDLASGKIAFETSFTMKLLAEMLCANMMGLRLDEARVYWDSCQPQTCGVAA